MPKYILQCNCDCFDFTYDADTDVFVCTECGDCYEAKNAGYQLIKADEEE